MKSYRTAHARVLSIDPFENALRENTPLTSINDSVALVEYLNQINLKSDMVLDELKRVSSERDTFKEEVTQMKQQAKKAKVEDAANMGTNRVINVSADSQDEQPDVPPLKHEPISESVGESSVFTPKNAKSGTARPAAGAVASLPLFSSPLKAEESPTVLQSTEDLFSYETELPRLESELKDRETEIRGLHDGIDRLKNDLSVARESTQSMVGTLEDATRGFQALQESKDQSDAEFGEHRVYLENTIQQLKSQLGAKEEELREALAESDVSNAIHKLEQQLQECQDELDLTRSRATLEIEASLRVEELLLKIKSMESEMVELQTDGKKNERRNNTLDSLVKSLRMQLSEADDEKKRLATLVADGEKSRRTLQHRVTQLQLQIGSTEQPKTESAAFGDAQRPNGGLHLPEATTMGKKKNKKKKKGSKSTTMLINDSSNMVMEPSTHPSGDEGLSANAQTLEGDLPEEVDRLRVILEEKDTVNEKLNEKCKREKELSEEVEMLRDDLVNLGQELVEAKDTAKALLAEKEKTLTRVQLLDKELAELHSTHASCTAGSAQNEKELKIQFEDLKMKASTLQTDLSAAQQLASSRFKDLSDLRYVLQKAQPEITALKAEVADARALKVAFGKKEADLERSEARKEETHAEALKLKQCILDRDSEIKTLSQQVAQETTNKYRAEELRTKTGQQIHQLETEKRQTTELLDRMSRDLAKSKEELASSKVRSNELEQQILQVSRENGSLREEIELKLAQYASVQNLMSSMRDQTAEMAVQMKEARDRCESLDEEVAEAHKLLGERSQEAETMRRLLVDVEARADSRTREMKERMDMAIEERDRAEDEASTAQRKRSRELEDVRNRMRETERSLNRAEEDKDELEAAQRDWKRRREELDQKLEEHTKEVEVVRRAMGELRNALDESERRVRELEKDKGELRKSIEDTQHRLEKLQRAHKVCQKMRRVLSPEQQLIHLRYLKSMADEMKNVQTAKTRAMGSETQSTRSSLDSAPARARLVSPTPKNSTPVTDSINGHAPGSMDYVYLKNVLLQFLEQKDKKRQVQLIPVLGMLLHFDR